MAAFLYGTIPTEPISITCISQALAKVPFAVKNGFLFEFNSKIVYNKKRNIAVIVRAFYEKKTCFDYMFIFFISTILFFAASLTFSLIFSMATEFTLYLRFVL